MNSFFTIFITKISIRIKLVQLFGKFFPLPVTVRLQFCYFSKIFPLLSFTPFLPHVVYWNKDPQHQQ